MYFKLFGDRSSAQCPWTVIALHSNLLNLLTVELLKAPIKEVSLEACLSMSIATRWDLNTPKGVDRDSAERFARKMWAMKCVIEDWRVPARTVIR